MRKTLLAAVAAITLLATPALAALNQFYHVQSGQWSIEGYTGDKNFCSAKTYWQNGSYVSLFVMRNSETFSLIVHNAEWDLLGQPGVFYDGTMVFTGQAGLRVLDGRFEMLDSQTIAFRDMTRSFLRSWIDFRDMKIDLGSGIPTMLVGLSGTADATSAYIACIDYLNN